MTVTALGQASIGATLPAVSGVLNATVFADLQAKLAALAAFQPTPVDFGVSLQILAEQAAALQLGFDVSVTPPEVAASLEAAAVVEFAAQLAAITALNASLLAAMHVYRYDGPVSDLGTELQAELSAGLPGGAGGDTAFALLAVATAASINAMKGVFKVEP